MTSADIIASWLTIDTDNSLEKQLKNIEKEMAKNVTEILGFPKPEAIPPKNSGVYLIGDTAFNPFTDEHYYYIKVGKSKDISNRMKQYKTHSSTTWYADFLETNEINRAETYYHSFLTLDSIESCGTEWFRVDRDTYLRICEKGFDSWSKFY